MKMQHNITKTLQHFSPIQTTIGLSLLSTKALSQMPLY